jgi:hypothetical protein
MEADTLVNLGNALCIHGQTPQGRDHWQQALTLMETANDPRTASLRSALQDLTPDNRRISL